MYFLRFCFYCFLNMLFLFVFRLRATKTVKDLIPSLLRSILRQHAFTPRSLSSNLADYIFGLDVLQYECLNSAKDFKSMCLAHARKRYRIINIKCYVKVIIFWLTFKKLDSQAICVMTK